MASQPGTVPKHSITENTIRGGEAPLGIQDYQRVLRNAKKLPDEEDMPRLLNCSRYRLGKLLRVIRRMMLEPSGYMKRNDDGEDVELAWFQTSASCEDIDIEILELVVRIEREFDFLEALKGDFDGYRTVQERGVDVYVPVLSPGNWTDLMRMIVQTQQKKVRRRKRLHTTAGQKEFESMRILKGERKKTKPPAAGRFKHATKKFYWRKAIIYVVREDDVAAFDDKHSFTGRAQDAIYNAALSMRMGDFFDIEELRQLKGAPMASDYRLSEMQAAIKKKWPAMPANSWHLEATGGGNGEGNRIHDQASFVEALSGFKREADRLRHADMVELKFIVKDN